MLTLTEDPAASNLWLTHSAGLVHAILQLTRMTASSRRSVRVVAMDPPDLHPDAIRSRSEGLDGDLQELYAAFLRVLPFPAIFVGNQKIVAYRDTRRILLDYTYYDKMSLYEEDTHRPYEIKRLRDRIVESLLGHEERRMEVDTERLRSLLCSSNSSHWAEVRRDLSGGRNKTHLSLLEEHVKQRSIQATDVTNIVLMYGEERDKKMPDWLIQGFLPWVMKAVEYAAEHGFALPVGFFVAYGSGSSGGGDKSEA